jgi:hypothetical protein
VGEGRLARPGQAQLGFVSGASTGATYFAPLFNAEKVIFGAVVWTPAAAAGTENKRSHHKAENVAPPKIKGSVFHQTV